MTLTCPHCSNEEQSKIAGVEVQGVYDGVLYWFCQACGKAWSRDWTGYGRRAHIAARLVDEHNVREA